MFTSNVYSITTNSCDDVFSRINQSRVLFVDRRITNYLQPMEIGFQNWQQSQTFLDFLFSFQIWEKVWWLLIKAHFTVGKKKVQFSEAAMFTSKGKINGFWNTLSKTLRRSL